MSAISSANYYTILQLTKPPTGNELTKEELRTAYHRALLVHHPDKAPIFVSKSSLNENESEAKRPRYSIDQIVTAYRTLSDRSLRSQYDEQLLNAEKIGAPVKILGESKGIHLGVETYDLDDMCYVESSECWTLSCRCGNPSGYVVPVADLEAEITTGEIYIGCRGCSLFIRVLFDAVENLDTEGKHPT